MSKLSILTVVLLPCALSACDEIDNDFDRAAIGAAVGCAAGEILVDGKCVEGAIIGGATGALADDF